MNRRNPPWIVMAAVAIAVAAAALLLLRDPGALSVAQMRDALLSSPYEMQINLSIDIPMGSESDNPPHQEIDAEGVIDLSSGEGDFTYDFNELNNAGGHLGHFEVMQVLSADGFIYLDVFIDGPAWVRTDAEAVQEDQIDRLRDILLTSPLTLPSYLDIEATGRETSDGQTFTIQPQLLATSSDPLAAEVGAFLDERGAGAIEVEIAVGDERPEAIVLTFAYDAQEDIGARIEVVATYELAPASAPDFEVPSEDDVREFSEFFG